MHNRHYNSKGMHNLKDGAFTQSPTSGGANALINSHIEQGSPVPFRKKSTYYSYQQNQAIQKMNEMNKSMRQTAAIDLEVMPERSDYPNKIIELKFGNSF